MKRFFIKLGSKQLRTGITLQVCDCESMYLRDILTSDTGEVCGTQHWEEFDFNIDDGKSLMEIVTRHTSLLLAN